MIQGFVKKGVSIVVEVARGLGKFFTQPVLNKKQVWDNNLRWVREKHAEKIHL